MAAKQKVRRWSDAVTHGSDALDLEPGVFTLRSPKAIAESLRRSAERSDRRKAPPFRSAMSMLVFYVNRAGRSLTEAQRERFERAKDELRALYGRPRKGERGGASRRSRGARAAKGRTRRGLESERSARR